MAIPTEQLIPMSDLAELVGMPVIKLVKYYRDLGWKECNTKEFVPPVMAGLTMDVLSGDFKLYGNDVKTTIKPGVVGG